MGGWGILALQGDLHPHFPNPEQGGWKGNRSQPEPMGARRCYWAARADLDGELRGCPGLGTGAKVPARQASAQEAVQEPAGRGGGEVQEFGALAGSSSSRPASTLGSLDPHFFPPRGGPTGLPTPYPLSAPVLAIQSALAASPLHSWVLVFFFPSS